jgi:glycosyltransferase involved in cell wall biosynthesis
MSEQPNPLVSVVVTTRNEERNIGNCLKSIKLQTYKLIEIIVVDNNSTDKTEEIARSFTEMVVNKGPERSAQRNHGICDLATGHYAMFIDADMILTPTLIESCVNQAQSKDVIALHIDEIILGRGLLAKIRRFERSFYSGTVIDGARFFDRNIFCRIGGFDTNLPPGPEDWDLDKRLKSIGRIGYLEVATISVDWEMADQINKLGVRYQGSKVGIFHNEDKQSLKRYLSKKVYYSPSMKPYVDKWGSKDQDVRKQLGISHRFFGVFVKNGNYRKSLAHPVLIFATISLRILVGVCYLARKRNL